jgi:SAM-dependent methyltransferase
MTLSADLAGAERALEAAFAGNSWFTDAHWPENRERVRAMLRDAERFRPAGRVARLLDLGCGNGFVSLLAARLGYQTSAVDAWEPPERAQLFAEAGVAFRSCNLNHPDALAGFAAASFDVVLIGEVLEHVLNHPLGLLREVRRVLAVPGCAIVTTPNPATLAAALRVLRGRGSLWGTRAFLDEPKIAAGRVITEADIHYREYTLDEVCEVVARAGLTVERRGYLPMGLSRLQSPAKRLVKTLLDLAGLSRTRLFGFTNYVVAVSGSS